MDNAVKLNSNILTYYKIYLNIISNIFVMATYIPRWDIFLYRLPSICQPA